MDIFQLEKNMLDNPKKDGFHVLGTSNLCNEYFVLLVTTALYTPCGLYEHHVSTLMAFLSRLMACQRSIVYGVVIKFTRTKHVRIRNLW